MKKRDYRLLPLIVTVCSAAWFAPFAQADDNKSLITDFVHENARGDIIEYASFKDWFLNCRTTKSSAKSRCELTTPIVIERDNAHIPSEISIKLVFENKNNDGIAIIQTPLELLLSKGINLEIDQNKLGKLTYRSCHAAGCLAPFSVSGRIKRAMLNGLSAELKVYDLQGQAKQTKFSLLGISSAIQHVDRYLKQN